MDTHAVVSKEEWLAARKAFLDKEKAHMRLGDALAAERRALPWRKVEKNYLFDTTQGQKSLGELFCAGEGQKQLIVHHLMYAPDWEAACPGCSYQAEHIDGPARHLRHHNVRIISVSRAPLEKLLAYKKRMGWEFEWVSSYETDFNYDFGVSFTKEQIAAGKVDYNFSTIETDPRYFSEELPGVSVFYKTAAGDIVHTYSTYARGLDALLGGSHYLDLVPEGRDDGSYSQWPRRRDEYAAT